MGGSLYLSGCKELKELPKNLAVSGSIILNDSGITSLPENLTVGGSLNLSGCKELKEPPKNLAVGWSLILNDSGITSLPENPAVGWSLYLSGTGIPVRENQKVKRLHNGDYCPGRWIYADGILTHIKKEKHLNGYTFYVGRIPGKNVIYDGTYYAHCDTLRNGISDLLFKSASDRGADQYKGISLDTELGVNEAVTMYRIITGACRQGSEQFVNSLGDKLKERYTIREMLELTKGQYGSERFAEFFSE